MEKNLGMNNIFRYLNEFKFVDKAAKEKSEKLEFEWPNETPLQSVTSKYNTNVIANDPFALLCNVIELALKNGDKIT